MWAAWTPSLFISNGFNDQAMSKRSRFITTVAPYLLPAINGHLTCRHEGIDIRVRETLTAMLALPCPIPPPRRWAHEMPG